MHLTMIDGKVATAVTETKFAMRCYLYKVTTKEVDNIDQLQERKIDTSSLKFGLPTLHAWMRSFEYLLRIGYECGIHKWQARGNTDKNIIKQRKSLIQEAFESELNLNINCPKPGFGSSDKANTARRFFKNSAVYARILGVDETLINKFYTIL